MSFRHRGTFSHAMNQNQYQSLAVSYSARQNDARITQRTFYKNSSGNEIANVNFLRRYGTYVLQNTKKENLLRLTN